MRSPPRAQFRSKGFDREAPRAWKLTSGLARAALRSPATDIRKPVGGLRRSRAGARLPERPAVVKLGLPSPHGKFTGGALRRNRRAYTHIRMYHACRPEDVSGYCDKGLLLRDRDAQGELFRWLRSHEVALCEIECNEKRRPMWASASIRTALRSCPQFRAIANSRTRHCRPRRQRRDTSRRSC